MRKPLTSWQVMSSIFKPELKPNKEEISQLNSFFFCSYLSNNQNSIKIAALLNLWYKIPEPVQYRFAKDYADAKLLSKKIKFISFNKQKTPPEMEKILGNISKKYKVNSAAAMEYFELMDNDQRNEVYEMYDHGIQK